MVTAKEQFLRDLQQDRDYIEHKKNCIMENFMSYHPANVNNDTYRLTDESSMDETNDDESLVLTKNNLSW